MRHLKGRLPRCLEVLMQEIFLVLVAILLLLIIIKRL